MSRNAKCSSDVYISERAERIKFGVSKNIEVFFYE
jgi:hypothetical protein